MVAAIAWAMAVPYVAEAVGLRLEVERRIEVIDHVIPGLVAAFGAFALARGLELPGSALIFLSGLFITTAHAPLIPDMSTGVAAVAPATLHLTAGPPILLMGVRFLVRSLR